MFAPREDFDTVMEVLCGRLQQAEDPRVAESRGSSQWLMTQQPLLKCGGF